MYIIRMLTKLTKWGNSFGLRIPKVFLAELGIKSGEEVELRVADKKMIIAKPRPSLSDLIRSITPENRHDAPDWGEPVGKELW